MLIDKLIGDLGDKRRWRQHRARIKALPAQYRTTVEALERYLMHAAGVAGGELWLRMLDDLGDLFEAAAADGTPVRTIVGADPVEFAEAFVRNYSGAQWFDKERRRLVEAVDRAEQDEGQP